MNIEENTFRGTNVSIVLPKIKPDHSKCEKPVIERSAIVQPMFFGFHPKSYFSFAHYKSMEKAACSKKNPGSLRCDCEAQLSGAADGGKQGRNVG
ncbi:hypothetical protein NDK47_00685 [Brevibacillus ruminantium]|uniref:Uncharacterized protein n=1 Tax=Brevibacillus ruminantium TaxID=2950604 RepID=A0ABY4WFI9_9BACL|nr:hypothetical protein [Brevibacillus ruminantium]USG65907.1 hypothetical protein NDK47_00685 [Brevibacillus ruminantium]